MVLISKKKLRSYCSSYRGSSLIPIVTYGLSVDNAAAPVTGSLNYRP